MAFDASSFWTGLLGRKYNKATLQVTTKDGDGIPGGSQDAGRTQTGLGWAEVVALTDGTADTAPLGSTANPIHTTSAAGSGGSAPYGAIDKGYVQQSVTVAAALSGVAAAIAAGATYAVIEPEGNNIRWRADGTNPTASIGNPVLIGQQLTYAATDLANLVVVSQSGTATVNINYYK